jgi:hypothetical protein
MAAAVQKNRNGLTSVKSELVRTLLNDHDALLKSTQEKFDAVKLETNKKTAEAAYDGLVTRYSNKLDFGATMQSIVDGVSTDPKI